MQSVDLGTIPQRVEAIRQRHRARDARHFEVQQVRRGNFEAVWPDAFSDVFKRPIVANLIDTTARDVASVLAPLPSFNCSASSMLSDTAKKFADKRTKIANNYIASSDLAWQMLRGADQFNTYGLLVLAVEPDFDTSSPWIKVEDAIGAYPVIDMRGRTKEFTRVWYADWFQLEADYPGLARLKREYPMAFKLPAASSKVEVIKYVSSTRTVVYLPDMGNAVLADIPNRLKRCPYVCVQRPGVDDEHRGAYDDVIWVQFARHRLQSLLIEGVDKSVRAPIVVPMDVDDVALGPDGVIHTNSGAGAVGRARLDMPAQAFGAVESLKTEQQLGAMSPEARSGAVDASVITGRGVQQLMASFSSQIAGAQAALSYGFKGAVELCFETDEAYWPNVEKEIRGQDNGVPYAVKYRPAKDIAKDHTIEVTYGFAAGLDANRALVFLLQAQAAGVISKDYLARNLPVGINPAEEVSKINIEQSRDAIIQAFAALSQSIPQLAAMGGDATAPIIQQAKFIELLQRGKSVEEAAIAALKPPEPPPTAAAPPGQETGAGGATGAEGFTSEGLPAGLEPGLATEGSQGRPDLQMLFAGLTGSGAPNLQAGVSRYAPAGA